MILTNKLCLPKQLENFIKSQGEHEFDDSKYSVTELLNPVREIILKRKHRDEIREDLADKIPALFGSAVHKLLEEQEGDGEPEVKLETEIEGKRIVGRVDLLDLKSKTISDWKTCSVSKVTKGDFEEWRLQGLAYAWLTLIRKGVKIEKLLFYAFMKDWSKVKMSKSPNYPSSAIYVWKYDIQDSDYNYIEEYLYSKLKALETAEITGILPDCTDEERWFGGDEWAVYKEGKEDKAFRVCSSEEEAKGLIENKLGGKGKIVKRSGECLKCSLYCPCREFCERRERDGE